MRRFPLWLWVAASALAVPAGPATGAGQSMPPDLKLAFEAARYRLEPTGSGAIRGENAANGFSVQFSAAETTIDIGSGAETKLTVLGYGWGSAVAPAGSVARTEVQGKRLERHYGTGLTEWFLNAAQGLEQGFVIGRRAARGTGALRIRLGVSGGWTVEGAGDRVQLSRGNVTLDYGGLKAWDARGAALSSRLRGSGSSVEIEVDDARAVYPLSIDPTFTQQQKLTASDGAAGDYFAYSVALSSDGNIALVGAFGSSGAVYVFTRSGVAWAQQQKLTASDEAANDLFGSSVTLSSDGNTALVGAYQRNSSQGAAYAFTRSGTTWTQQQKLTASDAAANDYFGWSLGLSGEGNTALIGALYGNSERGAAYVFMRSGASWTHQQELTASDAAQGDAFGYSVGLSGDGNTALVGAFEKNSFQGAAYVFALPLVTTPFNTGFALNSPSLRNNFGGFVGMQLTVIGSPLQVNSVGRICASGNSQTHLVKFVSASTGSDVAGGSASVNMAGCTMGTFVYTALASPITLAVGSSYYLVSQENAGGDLWYDSGAISTKSVASVTHSVYFYNGIWYVNGGANTSYVPPDFLYTVTPPSSTPAFVTTYNLNNAPLRNDFSGFVGMRFTVGSTPLDVTSLGRICVAGNSGTHTVKFVLDSTGVDVPGASAGVNMAACSAGQFVYTALGSPITLLANTAYYLASQETAGGDQWYDHGLLTTTTDAAVNNSVYFYFGRQIT